MTHLSTPTPMCPLARRLAALLTLVLVLAAPVLHAQTAGAQLASRPALLDALAADSRLQGADAASAEALARAVSAVLPPEQRLPQTSPVGAGRFGFSVAVSGSLALVGAYDDDSGRGAAYAFEYDGTTWVARNKLRAMGGVAGDNFGWAVAVSGDRAFVTAPGDGVGSVYAFVWTGAAWAQRARLVPQGTLGGTFGLSAAMSGDRAIVGMSSDVGTTVRGTAFVYHASGTTWTQQPQLFASDGVPGDNFGFSVAISGDRALVGAFADDSFRGSAYVYDLGSGVWTPRPRIRGAKVIPGDRFGRSVALSGDRALVGADEGGVGGNAGGAAFVFERTGSQWAQRRRLVASDRPPNFPDRWDERFGGAVALDGDVAVVGAQFARVDPTDTTSPAERGAAYAFAFVDGAWRETAKRTASDWATNDRFGSAVALSGGIALVGAWARAAGAGAAYALEIPAAPRIVVTSQQTAGELIAVGDTLVIRWESQSVPAVSISASVRTAPGEDDFTVSIIDLLSGDIGQFAWIVTDAFASPNVRIRVSDTSDLTRRGFSAEVRVRDPHRLVKVVEASDGQRTYEAFEPAAHAWTFRNLADPWWPQDVWLTDSLDYWEAMAGSPVEGYDPNFGEDVRYRMPHFHAVGPVHYPSWPSTTDAFGMSRTIVNGAALVSELKTLFESDEAAPQAPVLGILATTGSTRGAHAVVPYRVESDGGATDRVYVYDSNYGADDGHFVSINNATGEWIYVTDGTSWSSIAADTLVLMGAGPTAFRLAEAPWTVEASPGLAGRPGGVPAFVAVDASASSVTTADGATLRYADRTISGAAPGVRVVHDLTGRPSPPLGYDVAPGASYTLGIETASAPGERARLDVGRGLERFGVEVAGGPASVAVRIGPAGPVAVENRGPAGAPVRVSAMAQLDNGDERMWRLDGLSLSTGAAVTAEVTDGEQALRVAAPSAATVYHLVVVEGTVAGVRTFAHADVPLAGGSVHTVRPSWGTLDTGPVMVDIDADGDGDTDETLTLANEGIIGAESPMAAPLRLAVAAFPNPARGMATVSATLSAAGFAAVAVLDVLGREVARLHDSPLAAGTHTFALDASALPAGVYVVRLLAGSEARSQRLVVVR